MSSSNLMYLDRGGAIHIADSDALPQSDDTDSLIALAIEIIKAGYKGVIIDQYRLQNGRYFQAINGNIATPEGFILDAISANRQRGVDVPPSEIVLIGIRDAYKKMENEK